MSARDVVLELFEVLDSGSDWPDARCRDRSGATIRLFFSDKPSEIAVAKSVCAGCQYRSRCLEGALERGEACGVWGGELIANGKIIAHKRGRGRPPKNPRPEIRLSA
jgi:WhiB family transcriptional regulator, redox-sensing transcriptional regulator